MLVRHALMPASGRWVGVAHWRALPKDEERTYRYTKFTHIRRSLGFGRGGIEVPSPRGLRLWKSLKNSNVLLATFHDEHSTRSPSQ